MKEWHIHLTNQAYKRFKQYRWYICSEDLLKLIRGAIFNLSKIGIELDEEGIGKVRVRANIYAVVQLEGGTWKVKDFIRIHSGSDKMPINSRAKGARGERELASLLRDHGFETRRGQQYCGSNGDAKEEEIPIVCHRKDRSKWLVTMEFDSFMKIYRVWGS